MRLTCLGDHRRNILGHGGGQRPARQSAAWPTPPDLVDRVPPFRRGEGAGQDAVDVPDRLGLHWPAHVRAATGQPAVVVPARPPRPAAWASGVCFSRYQRGTALPEEDQSLVGQDGEGMLQCRGAYALERVQFADRGEWVAGGERPGTDRVPQPARGLLPAGRESAGSATRTGMWLCSVNGLPVHDSSLHCSAARRAGRAPGRVPSGSEGPDGGLDGPPDVAFVRFPR